MNHPRSRNRFISIDLKAAIHVFLALTGLVFFTEPLFASENGMLIERRDGYVDSGGVMIYFEAIGQGPPLMVLHGGPGSTHDYFLPHFLPFARRHRLVFIDERGSGRSQAPSDPTQYNLNAMVKDVEAVRVALNLGRIDLMGHSFGGILAQAYAIAHSEALRSLILASTGSSAERIDADFALIKNSLEPDLRKKIDELERRGIFDKSGAQSAEYRKLADQAELPYNYHMRPPAWDTSGGALGWDVLREMWVRKSDFHIDGNLRGFDFTPDLKKLTVPALIIYGDHDLLTAATAQQSHAALAGSRIVEVPRSAHMTFVDQPEAFIDAVEAFLDAK
jgi:proline iminopeptidase